MVLKRKLSSPQKYIQVGMAFFLMGLFASQMADGRLIGAFFIKMLPGELSMDAIQGMAAGFSIPILCASIFFNLRGLTMLRSQ